MQAGFPALLFFAALAFAPAAQLRAVYAEAGFGVRCLRLLGMEQVPCLAFLPLEAAAARQARLFLLCRLGWEIGVATFPRMRGRSWVFLAGAFLGAAFLVAWWQAVAFFVRLEKMRVAHRWGLQRVWARFFHAAARELVFAAAVGQGMRGRGAFLAHREREGAAAQKARKNKAEAAGLRAFAACKAAAMLAFAHAVAGGIVEVAFVKAAGKAAEVHTVGALH